jgi:hypothetical protein
MYNVEFSVQGYPRLTLKTSVYVKMDTWYSNLCNHDILFLYVSRYASLYVCMCIHYDSQNYCRHLSLIHASCSEYNVSRNSQSFFRVGHFSETILLKTLAYIQNVTSKVNYFKVLFVKQWVGGER